MAEISGPRLYRRGGIWWCRVGGERVSTRCRDRKAADRRARELERVHADPRHAAATRARLDVACERYLETLERKQRSGATIEIATQKTGHFLRLWGRDFPLSEIDARLVARYVATRETEHVTQHTIHKEIGALRAVLRLARHQGDYHLHTEDVLPLDYATGHRPRERWLTPEELTSLLAALRPDRAAHIAFFVATGARLSESLRAVREDVGEHTVLLRGSKTKQAFAHVPVTEITRPLLALVLRQAHGRDPSARLFASWGKLHRDLALACSWIGIPPCTPNDLRRTFGTWHRRAGAPLDLIASLLRHTTTKLAESTYAKLDPGQRTDALALGKLLEQHLSPPKGQLV